CLMVMLPMSNTKTNIITMDSLPEGENYVVSLITLYNAANRPFYYHNTISLLNVTKSQGNVTHVTENNYGFYPQVKTNMTGVLAKIYKVIRLLLPVASQIMTPDHLYVGRSAKV